MNEMNYEFTTMVNRNHQKAKAREYQIPKYTDHEIRMQQLRRKAEAERPKANREAIKFGLMMVVGILFMIMGYFAIKSVWFYSIAVRGL